ncbi:MAG: hypothetical protein IJE92_05535 [Clostridia bacterium]|nr:hypothetical protein [Clostridia bacterium]
MTDKQQIEEMKKILLNSKAVTFEPNVQKTYGQYRYDKFFVSNNDGHLTIDYGKFAEALYNVRYRKVPKNAVVLTKREKQKLLHEMHEQGKFDVIAECAEGKTIMLSSTQVQILRHSLGMDNKPIMNNRYHAYRNYFETSFDAPNKSCDLLKHWGLMEAKPHQRGITFRVTEKGIKVLQEFLGIEIIIK